jgi:DNA-binding CsgD family transcriptional regulator
MRQWRETRKPGYFQGGRDDHLFPAEWVAIFNKYDLRNTIGHATLDRHGVVGEYFIFARLDEVVGPRHAEILELVTPNLSLALSQAMKNEVCDDDFAGAVQALISNKQREILQWIYQGKTNWEISKILEMNEETIKYHVDQVMAKLNVKTRAQAVGRALEIGAISAIKRVATQPAPKEEPKPKRGK